MKNKSTADNKAFEESILGELQTFTPQGIAGSKNLTFRLMSRLRAQKWLIRPFNTPSIRSTEPDTTILNKEEETIFNTFRECRQQHIQLSYYYSDQYKGSFVLNYMLAIITVALAVISLLLLCLSETIGHRIVEPVVIIFGVLKLFFLLIISTNTHQANKQRFNERAIIYRYLLEQWRYMMYLPLLGIYKSPLPTAGRFISHALRNNYLEQYIRTKINEIRTTLNQAEDNEDIHFKERLLPVLQFMQAEWVRPQITYQTDKKIKQENLDERFEKWVNRFNTTVIGIVVLDLLGSIGLFIIEKAGLAHTFEWFEHFKEPFHQVAAPLLLTVATIIPVMVASFNALRFQTEARSLAERADAMADAIADLDSEYTKLISEIERNASDTGHTEVYTMTAVDLARNTAQVMTDEVTEWTFIYANLVLDT